MDFILINLRSSSKQTNDNVSEVDKCVLVIADWSLECNFWVCWLTFDAQIHDYLSHQKESANFHSRLGQIISNPHHFKLLFWEHKEVPVRF